MKKRPTSAFKSTDLLQPIRVMSDRLSRWLVALVILLLPFPVAAEPLRISGVHYLGDLPTLVAEQNGYFSKHGLEVDVVYDESGRDNLKRLRAGEIDFALMAMTPLVFDALANPERGGPDDPVILANLSHARPVIHVITLDAPVVPPGEALRGRTVGVPFGSNAHYVMSVIASIGGLEDNDYTLVDINPAEMSDALATGRISAVSVWDPWARQIKDRFGERLSEEPDVGHYVSRWMLVTRRGTVETEPDRAIAVLNAYRDAVDWIQTNHDAALALHEARWSGAITRVNGIPSALLFDVTLDWSLIATYRQQLLWARRLTNDQGQALPSFMDLVAPAPLTKIAPQAVLIPHGGRQ